MKRIAVVDKGVLVSDVGGVFLTLGIPDMATLEAGFKIMEGTSLC